MNPIRKYVPSVFCQNSGRVVCTSINVAEVFGKRHDHVLRAIENLTNDLSEVANAPKIGAVGTKSPNASKIASVENKSPQLFAVSEYRDLKGETRPCYTMTRDGFVLLAMGFTGKKALQFKLAYINAFNAMEQAQNQPRKPISLGFERELALIAKEQNEWIHATRDLLTKNGIKPHPFPQSLQSEASIADGVIAEILWNQRFLLTFDRNLQAQCKTISHNAMFLDPQDIANSIDGHVIPLRYLPDIQAAINRQMAQVIERHERNA